MSNQHQHHIYCIACTFLFRFLSGQWSPLFRFECVRASKRANEDTEKEYLHLSEWAHPKISKLIYNLNVYKCWLCDHICPLHPFCSHTAHRYTIVNVNWDGKMVCAKYAPLLNLCNVSDAFDVSSTGYIWCVQFWWWTGCYCKCVKCECEQHNLLWFVIMHGKWVFEFNVVARPRHFSHPATNHIPNDSNDLSQIIYIQFHYWFLS